MGQMPFNHTSNSLVVVVEVTPHQPALVQWAQQPLCKL